MGILKDAKANMLGTEALRAANEGRTVFTPRLNAGAVQHGMSGSISGWAEMIEAVEAAGWHLTDWATGHDSKGGLEAYPIFRRA